MKRTLLILGTFMVFLMLAACDSQQDNDVPVNNDAVSNEEETTASSDKQENNDSETEDDSKTSENSSDSDMKSKMDELDYDEFELEADYGPDSEYEIEIEQDNNRIEAEIEDELNGEYLEGQEAFDKIYPNVKKLTIDQNTSKEDTIDQVLKAFDLDSDYQEIEIEITFKDGTKIEFEDK